MRNSHLNHNENLSPHGEIVRYLISLISVCEAMVISYINSSFAMYDEHIRGHRSHVNSNSMYIQDLLSNSIDCDPMLKVCHTQREGVYLT